MSSLKLFLFGPPHVEHDNQPLKIRRRKEMALLAYLTLTDQIHSREVLATLLWPEFDRSRALSNLRRELSRLKSDMDSDLFLADRKQLSLDPEADLWVDVERFKTLLATVDDHNHFPAQGCQTCLAALTEATALYTDDFMAGFALPDAPGFDEWHFFERENLRRSLSEALQKLIEWHSDQGQYGDAMVHARRWLSLDTLHEPAHRTLMALYARDGQRAAALRQYEECARLLEEELGVEPELATVDLYEAIRKRHFPSTQPASLGDEAVAQGKYLEAQSWYQEELQRARATEDDEGMARAWRGLGRASLGLDHVEMAQGHFLEALRRVQAAADKNLALSVLADMVAYYTASREPVRALELGAFVAEHPLSGQEIKEQVDTLLAEAGDLPADRLAEARERAGRRKLWDTVAELIEDLTRATGRADISRLPIPPTPFIGRKQEVADVRRLLLDDAGNRLLTLIGPGGIGKTHLALEAASQSKVAFPDGAFFVPLASLSSADQIVIAIAEGVDFHFFGPADPAHQLCNYLGDKEMLLVLDNFEHLLEGATVVLEILRLAPSVHIIVTSREALNVSGETLYPLQGLSVPTGETLSAADVSDYDAVELLLQQARRARPGFDPDTDDLWHAARIVRLVEGMPLALVMAAGWLEILSLAEIAEEIANNLSFLESTARDLPERQRSMRAAFDYSWQRLPASEQQAFMKLSVFRGGFNRQAAQAISGAGLRTLRMLVNKSFLSVNDSGRFEVHELLRQYGWEHLEASGALDRVQSAHSQYFLRALQQREADMKSGRQLEAFAEIEVDRKNVLAAWHRAVEMEREDLLADSYRSLHLFFHMTGRYHGAVPLFHSACKQFAPDSAARPRRIWRLLVPCLVYNASNSGSATLAMKQDLEVCLKLAQTEADRFQEGLCLLTLGCYALFVEQDTVVAVKLLQRCLKLFRSLDEQFSVALGLVWLGFAHGQNGQPDLFRSLCQQSLEIALETGNLVVASAARQFLGFAPITTGDYAAAERYCHQALESATESGRWQTRAIAQLHLGLLSFLQGEVERAREWATKGLRIAERINVDFTKSYAYSILSLCASISADSGLGQEMSEKSRLLTAPFYYRIMSNWAHAVSSSAMGDEEAAWDSLQNALQQVHESKFPAMITWLMPVAAILLARVQQPELAAELLALSFHHPQSASGWLEHWSPIKALRKSLQEELGEDRYHKAWARGRGLELEAAVTALLAAPPVETDAVS